MINKIIGFKGSRIQVGFQLGNAECGMRNKKSKICNPKSAFRRTHESLPTGRQAGILELYILDLNA
jgi:hypothetical protein